MNKDTIIKEIEDMKENYPCPREKGEHGDIKDEWICDCFENKIICECLDKLIKKIKTSK